MIRKQLIMGLGALCGFGVTALVLANASACPTAWLPTTDDTAARLAFAAHWLLAPGLTLLVGVMVAARRGFIADAIDGTRTPTSHSLEINLRYNQNTLEQTMLAVIAWTGLALTLPRSHLDLIPAMAALFVLGRAAFWIGYLIHPLGRGFGMVLTVAPTLGAYAWLLWRCAKFAAH